MIAVVEGLHFLRNNIRLFTDGTGEQLCFFNNRQADLLITVLCKHCGDHIFNVLPQYSLIRQYVMHATNSLYPYTQGIPLSVIVMNLSGIASGLCARTMSGNVFRD